MGHRKWSWRQTILKNMTGLEIQVKKLEWIKSEWLQSKLLYYTVLWWLKLNIKDQLLELRMPQRSPSMHHWFPSSRERTKKNGQVRLTCQRSETAPAARGGLGPWQQDRGETRAPAPVPPLETPPNFSGSPWHWCPFWSGSHWCQGRISAPPRWYTRRESPWNPSPQMIVQVRAHSWYLPPQRCDPSRTRWEDWILAPLQFPCLMSGLAHHQRVLWFLQNKHRHTHL